DCVGALISAMTGGGWPSRRRKSLRRSTASRHETDDPSSLVASIVTKPPPGSSRRYRNTALDHQRTGLCAGRRNCLTFYLILARAGRRLPPAVALARIAAVEFPCLR